MADDHDSDLDDQLDYQIDDQPGDAPDPVQLPLQSLHTTLHQKRNNAAYWQQLQMCTINAVNLQYKENVFVNYNENLPARHSYSIVNCRLTTAYFIKQEERCAQPHDFIVPDRIGTSEDTEIFYQYEYET